MRLEYKCVVQLVRLVNYIARWCFLLNLNRKRHFVIPREVMSKI